MALSIVETGRERANDFQTVEELGSSIHKTAALLRAAINASDRDDESSLVSIAREQIEAAESRYME